MPSKLFSFLLCPFFLFASAGYELPWGKDADLAKLQEEKKVPSRDSFAVTAAKKIIVFHQKILSPVDGPRSNFYPCSSQYMKLAMTKHGFFKGLFMGCDRLMRENEDPWAYRSIVINGEMIKYDPPL